MSLHGWNNVFLLRTALTGVTGLYGQYVADSADLRVWKGAQRASREGPVAVPPYRPELALQGGVNAEVASGGRGKRRTAVAVPHSPGLTVQSQRVGAEVVRVSGRQR